MGSMGARGITGLNGVNGINGIDVLGSSVGRLALQYGLSGFEFCRFHALDYVGFGSTVVLRAV